MHYAVLVAGEDIEAILEPYYEENRITEELTIPEFLKRMREKDKYWENRAKEIIDIKSRGEELPPYLLGGIYEEVIKRYTEYTDEDWLRYYEYNYTDEDDETPSLKIDRKNNKVMLNNFYNYRGKFDYYTIGGRWDKSLLLNKETVKSMFKKNLGIGSNLVEYIRVNQARKKEIAWDHPDMQNFAPYGIVTKDQWIDRETTNTDGIEKNEKWFKIFRHELEKIPDDELLTLIDMHR